MRTFRFPILAFALLAIASPAAAQWTAVPDVPADFVYSVWAKGDTIAAGTDSVAWVSTNAGATWKRTARIAAEIPVEAVRVRNGRLYAGTYGQGVFISDDLGDTWTAYNQGLVGGIANAQLFIKDLLFRGDSLYAATAGAGPWVRNLVAGNWARFGNALEANQASNMNAIAAGGSRLVAAAGFNGTTFFRDPGQPDWTLTWLNNAGIVPGLAALSAFWTGTRWLVGSNVGVFQSALGQSPWSLFDPGLGTLFTVSFAHHGADVIVCFGSGSGSTIETSSDGGNTWDELETLTATFTNNLAVSGDVLYAARLDGLWRRPLDNASVPPGGPVRLSFVVVGSQPVRDDVAFRFHLPEAGPAVIEVFDAAGRRAADPIEGTWTAGPHQIGWSARSLAPGVYHARLTTSSGSAVVRLIRVR